MLKEMCRWNLEFLEEKMRQTGHYVDAALLTMEGLAALLGKRIDQLSIERAKEEIIRFIRDPRLLDGWSKGTFHAATKRLKIHRSE